MKATEHKETGEKMHIYEVSFLVATSVSESQLPEEVSSIRSVIEAAGASIIAEEFPKLITLAYQMEKLIETKRRKFNDGYFGWFKFEMPVGNISNIKQDLDKRTHIIRHLIVKTVRENTMYSTRLIDSEGKTDEADAVTTPTGEGKVEDKAAVEKTLDKNIDALVIS